MTMRRWVDWVNVMFGVWLIASPWFLTVTDKPAAWSSWIVGAGIVSLAFFSMYKPAVWGDTLGIMAGAWLVASPWMLGFAGPAAAQNAVIIGVLVIGYALWAMRIDITSVTAGRMTLPLIRRYPASPRGTRSIES